MIGGLIWAPVMGDSLYFHVGQPYVTRTPVDININHVFALPSIFGDNLSGFLLNQVLGVTVRPHTVSCQLVILLQNRAAPIPQPPAQGGRGRDKGAGRVGGRR